MSIQFDDPMNESAREMIDELFKKDIVIIDDKTVLLESEKELQLFQARLKEIANAANQPVTVNLHNVGDIVKMSDGTQYQVTEHGWKKQ